MKRKVLLVLSVVFLLSVILGACGSKGSDSVLNDTTWVISGARDDSGIEVGTEAFAMFGLDDFKLEFKKGGKVTVTAAGETADGTWTESNNTVTIKSDEEEITANIDGEELTINQDGMTLCFKKQ